MVEITRIRSRLKAWVLRLKHSLIKMLGGYTEQIAPPKHDSPYDSLVSQQKTIPLHRITVSGTISLDAFRKDPPDVVLEHTKWELLDKMIHELKTGGVVWSTCVDDIKRQKIIQATCYVVPVEHVCEVPLSVGNQYSDVIKLI